MPLDDDESFNKTVPEVDDRGNSYTKGLGVNTVYYYPPLQYTVKGWSLSTWSIPAVLFLLTAGGLVFILGKRRLARLGALGQNRLSSFLPGVWVWGGAAGGSEVEYHKLETTDST
jgi:hypothetical protein